ncbi:MAG: exodeoxyribonuclease VII large subunit [Bacteroidota bacterium]|nr:exodeoxyribonuclease VII large subunit [Bacteroidota bacterium]
MPEACSLYELNERIKDAISVSFSQPLWVKAEISEMRENANGHCYLELIEKDSKSDRITVRNKATIWSFTYRMLKPYFEATTGEQLHAGVKILIACTVEYHELYGLSLNISDIDPTYTLGEVALRRQQIINQLQEEGIVDMNKELELAVAPQRIAVISSSTTAGYGDFLDQLQGNSFGFQFYTHLFPAIMQGDRSEQSLIEALDVVYQHIDQFDAVVIIRGGGATADLSCFDRYSLAAHTAQFPLPVLTGIGHQRDNTILDMVAYSCLKTPTAVAEFLVNRMQQALGLLEEQQENLVQLIDGISEKHSNRLQELTRKLPQLLLGRTTEHKMQLDRCQLQLKQAVKTIITNQNQKLSGYSQPLSILTNRIIREQRHLLGQKELQLKYINPLTILEKGYTMTYANGKRVTSVADVQSGDRITTAFKDGNTDSIAE